MANVVTQWVTEALTDVAADQVARVELVTNVGRIPINQPIAASGAPPGISDRLAAVFQPQIAVYLKRNPSKPAFVYAPYGAPNPTPTKSWLFGTAMLGVFVLGGLSLFRGLTK